MLKTPKQFLRNATDAFLTLLYPKHCVVCGEVLSFQDNSAVCESCADLLPTLTGALCTVCGRAVISEGETCADCRNAVHIFTHNFALFPYDDTARDLILRYKASGHIAAAADIARLLFNRFPASALPAFDCIVPVPSHKTRHRARGFTPTILVAKSLAPLYDRPCVPDALRVTRNLQQQHTLPAASRKQNVDGAYAVQNAAAIAGKTVLLFDDILTTGATMNACAKTLLDRGAKCVFSMTIAVANRKNA